MNFEIEDYIDFHVLFVTMCLLIFYRYITDERNIVLERKLRVEMDPINQELNQR
jgi:hypothetical protein